MFHPFGSTGTGSTSPFGTPQPQPLQQQPQQPQQPLQQQQQQQASGGFGGFGSSAFGAPVAPVSAFGTAPTTTSAFGQPSGFAGSAPRYTPTTDMENNISITLQTIAAMPVYANKSLEELRLEDYLAGRKGGVTTGGAFGVIGGPIPSSTSTGSGFGHF